MQFPILDFGLDHFTSQSFNYKPSVVPLPFTLLDSFYKMEFQLPLCPVDRTWLVKVIIYNN